MTNFERQILMSVSVLVDDRFWEAKYWRAKLAIGDGTIEYWTVRDGEREAMLEEAPPLGESRDPARWAALLEPYVKRTIYNRGW